MSQLVSTLSTLARRKIVAGGEDPIHALNQVLDEAIEAEPNGVLLSREKSLRVELTQQLSAYGPLV